MAIRSEVVGAASSRTVRGFGVRIGSDQSRLEDRRRVDRIRVHHGGEPLEAREDLCLFPFFELDEFAPEAVLQEGRDVVELATSFARQGHDDRSAIMLAAFVVHQAAFLEAFDAPARGRLAETNGTGERVAGPFMLIPTSESAFLKAAGGKADVPHLRATCQ